MRSTERLEVVGSETYLTREQVSERLQVSLRTIDRYVVAKKLRGVKLPGDRLVRFPESAVLDLLKDASA